MIILANLAEKSQSTNFLEMAFQLIFLIFVFVAVIFLAYYSTKFIAGAKIKTMEKNNMKVIETISIGFNNIHIIKVNKQYFLISSSKEGIRILSEINGEDLIISDNNINVIPFEKQFKQYINNINKKDKKGGKYEE
ncbi:flagellar biosynthetic protein FliO [uncultured Tyzzerella sp.]|uniref:flagellar biosynthetic protein FliO n=1 Tax=uncultured Tyzzerella sp. TaxID=2321398 RepID=UPI002941F883|nr:flagellar biosynthetic protein FliO [uncultured Tyzzerella sp.]